MTDTQIGDDSTEQLHNTRVLSIASHVVHGYVGNTVTTFVMQCLGLEVSAMNTVQFTNHTGYSRWKGTKSTPAELRNLYEGLKENQLDDFGMLLTGYVPGAEGLEEIGKVAKEIKEKRRRHGRGTFFWVLDPVMGDDGKIYVSELVLPVYKSLLPYADLITPNQYEVEWLTGIKLSSVSDIITTIKALHEMYHIPHVIISSVQLPTNAGKFVTAGSSMTSTGQPRAFQITVPMLEGPFVGTGDMFAALTVSRMREQAVKADVTNNAQWISPDDVCAQDLPLAKTAELVIGSMHRVLARTGRSRERKLADFKAEYGKTELIPRWKYMKAAELQLVQSWQDIRDPDVIFHAEELNF